jgi:hypothetical protein
LSIRIESINKDRIAKLNSKGAAAMAIWYVADSMKNTAEWRREKAEEFPDDSRNMRAAKELERLAKEVNELEGSEIYQRVEALDDGATDDDNYDLVRWLSEELRAIGFRTYYENGAKFLESYCETLQELQRRRTDQEIDGSVPSPNLVDLVENDETVKAAKQAYEEARAKAYAEARKRL